MDWVCPFCQRAQAITAPKINYQKHKLDIFSQFGDCGCRVEAIACANKDCGQVQLKIFFGKGTWIASPGQPRVFELYADAEVYSLRPASSAKPQPASVPEVLSKDYYEACAVRDLSPKASATLSRRVLQGMIRDFCKISKATLKDEIDALKAMADAGNAPQGVAYETIDAMDHVRSIGNIGAHMEKDINVVVDVDPGEAQALIELIEMLFKDWYVAKANREQRLLEIRNIASEKQAAKKTKPS